ncbi:hypothetical protein ACFL6S_30700 [Candidatus Poribacteria bacterium]
MEMAVSERIYKALPQITRFLENSIKGSRYTATFERGYSLDEGSWLPILESKFGNCVGGLIVLEPPKGFIIILPQIRGKEEAILTLLREVLPDIAPHLFPHVEGAKWVERPEYELTSILNHKKEKDELEQRLRAGLEELDKRIGEERERSGFLHGIITKTGYNLVLDVKSCLEFIGFEKVIDVDEQMSDQEDPRPQEDLQILDRSPALLLEIKGISGLPDESDVNQVIKYVSRRMKDWDTRDVHGVSIINHERHLPALERNNKNVFTRAQIRDAENQEITLLTTWDLFLLVRGKLRWGWDAEAIKQLFYESGRISSAPTIYKPIGKIAKYWPEAEVISVEMSKNIDHELQKGDRIGYVTSTGYLEEEASSLQIGNEPVERASSGQKVGIKTEYPRDLLRKGMIVYKVILLANSV